MVGIIEFPVSCENKQCFVLVPSLPIKIVDAFSSFNLSYLKVSKRGMIYLLLLTEENLWQPPGSNKKCSDFILNTFKLKKKNPGRSRDKI